MTFATLSNDEAFDLMKTFNVSQIWMEKLSSVKNKIFSDEEMRRKLDYIFSPNGYKATKKKVLEAVQLLHIIKVQTYLWLPHF